MTMRILGIAGWSGAGKTTLIAKLIPELTQRGIRVSTLKHAHHEFDIDTPGKDSYVHRAAGATEVMVGSGKRWALMHELRDAVEPDVAELVRHMSPVDLLLIEGFKRDPHDKIEIFRGANAKPLLSENDPTYVAILSDGVVPQSKLPVIDLNDTSAIADFVVAHCHLATTRMP
jgi:molybdopterin-guanine dinucleotide biosynthesis protein B